MGYEANIQWFPGHMTKTKRMMEENMKLVDAVVEIVDSRIPESSRNPVINELVGNKPRIILLNKCDYSDDNVTKQWKQYYEQQGFAVLQCDCRSGKGINQFVPMLKTKMADVISKRKEKGMIGKALRIMVVGIPNVGKSSFINRMAGSRKTAVADRPGVTRGKQWVTIDREVELLDMPGILWPKFNDQNVALQLAFTGAIKDDVIDIESLAHSLVERLKTDYPQNLKERYKLSDLDGYVIEKIAKSRGMMVSGGKLDTERAAIAIVDEFRSGKIGKITLEKPKKA